MSRYVLIVVNRLRLENNKILTMYSIFFFLLIGGLSTIIIVSKNISFILLCVNKLNSQGRVNPAPTITNKDIQKLIRSGKSIAGSNYNLKVSGGIFAETETSVVFKGKNWWIRSVISIDEFQIVNLLSLISHSFCYFS